ncbi:MAG: carboxylating nicotinate-nucleotide diphosphorylase [Methylococcus sp.]|nr:MAG: carboxylating nicotinate-nucleotide diphosphorylase [Methylococcus sp.]
MQSENIDPERVRPFLMEDLGSGDLTSDIVPVSMKANATVCTRESMILCGREWFAGVFRLLDESCEISWDFDDGDPVLPDSRICTVFGMARALLTGERTALNLLQTLCSTATVSRSFADAVAGTGTRVLDTRKTIPGLRIAQKYAVRLGGCTNHRVGLFDAILIKENHIFAAGSIQQAIDSARSIHPGVPIEVEVESIAELEQVLHTGAERILLDNFSLQQLRSAVEITNRRSQLEASGNVRLENVRKIAETGVDFISVGSLTKDVKAVDLSMNIDLVR